MTIMLLGLVVFTTFVLFFGTAMAHLAWKVFEKDSDRVIQRSRQTTTGITYPPKQHQASRTSQPSPSAGGSRPSYAGRHQAASARSSGA